MKIEVKNLLNQPEGTVENYPIELGGLQIDDTTQAKFTGAATLTNLGNFILAKITGKATLLQLCSRCLKEVELTLPLNFSREFHTTPPSANWRSGPEDSEAYPIVDGEIDLDPVILEEIIANIPIKVLCQENCQGLCPKCGANLNDNPCKCDKVNYEISNKINL